MEIVIICSWNSLNPHSVHANCRTCDPLGLEVACSCKETQTRVSSLARCSLHLLYCAFSSRVFFCKWLLSPSALRTLDFLVLYAHVSWKKKNKNISWNFILPLMSSLTFQIQDVWLTLQINCCFPYIDHFPNWGLREGACQTVIQ